MKQWLVLIVVALLVMVGGATISAQDTVGEPIGLGDVTGDSASYYGQTVTIQAVIGEFVSSNVFVLTDAAVLSNNSVLVINNSGRPLPNSYVKGQEVIVTGRVHPSFSEVFNGNVQQFPSFYEERMGMMGTDGMGQGTGTGATVATQDPGLMTTPDAAGMATQDPNMMTTPTAAQGATGNTGDASGTTGSGGAASGTGDTSGSTGTGSTGGNSGTGSTTGAGDSAQATPVGGTGAEATPVGGTTGDSGMMATPVPGGNMGMGDSGMMGPMPYEEDMLAWVYGEALPDEYDVFTIIELTDINQLMYPSDIGG
ncbi:MAG: hypothetical protein SF123_05510 [Chloroflexota bacterium]|nr:hypothetical protein [Chloroflexota bacterium]